MQSPKRPRPKHRFPKPFDYEAAEKLPHSKYPNKPVSLFFDINAGTIYNLNERQLELINTDTGQLSKVFDLETDRIISGVSVGYNSFFYVDADGIVYAHDANSGNLKWTKELEDVVLSRILITSTQAFLQTSSDILYGQDLQTGEIKWQKQAQAPLLSIRGTASPIILSLIHI